MEKRLHRLSFMMLYVLSVSCIFTILFAQCYVIFICGYGCMGVGKSRSIFDRLCDITGCFLAQMV